MISAIADAKRVYVATCTGACLLVLIGLLPMPYGFYILLRLGICVCAVTGVVWARALHQHPLAWAYIGVVLVYNPVIPIHLRDKAIWVVVNLATVLFLTIAGWLLNKKEKSASSLSTSLNVASPASTDNEARTRGKPEPEIENTIGDLASQLVNYALTESQHLFSEFVEENRLPTKKQELVQFETTVLALIGAKTGAREALTDSHRDVLDVQVNHALKKIFGKKRGEKLWDEHIAARCLYYNVAATGPNVRDRPATIIGRVFVGSAKENGHQLNKLRR